MKERITSDKGKNTRSFFFETHWDKINILTHTLKCAVSDDTQKPLRQKYQSKVFYFYNFCMFLLTWKIK